MLDMLEKTVLIVRLNKWEIIFCTTHWAVYHKGGQTFSTEGHIKDFVATEGCMLVSYILHL